MKKKLTFCNPFLIVKTYELISLYSNFPNLNTCDLLIDFFKSSKALFCLLICFYRKVKINRSTNQIKQGDQAITVIRKDLEFILEVLLSLTDLPRVSSVAYNIFSCTFGGIYCEELKDTANPLSHHLMASSRRPSFSQALAPTKY